MRIASLIICLLFFLTTTQAQLQHQIGFEVGMGVNKIHYTVDPNVRFVMAPDLSSTFTPGIMANLKYDLIIAKHLHLGIGLGVEAKESDDNNSRAFERNQVETTNLILPIEVGYRSPSFGKMYLTGDVLFMPHATVRSARVIYLPQGNNGQESEYLWVEHRPFNIQAGAKLGAGWALTERLDFQLSLLGRVDLWEFEPESSPYRERYWGIQLNAGLRWTL